MKFSSVVALLTSVVIAAVSPICFAQDQRTDSGNTSDRNLTIIEQQKPKEPSGDIDVQGTVYLRVTFLANGEIGDVLPVKEVPHLTELAVEAARKIRFDPEIRGGKPTAITRIVIYAFSWESGWRMTFRKYRENSICDQGKCTVRLKVEFLASGKLGSVELASSDCGDKELEQTANEAARGIQFEPAQKDGKPLTTIKTVEYRFKCLEDGEPATTKAWSPKSRNPNNQ